VITNVGGKQVKTEKDEMKTNRRHRIGYRLVLILLLLVSLAGTATAQLLPIPILPGPTGNSTTGSSTSTSSTTTNSTTGDSAPKRYIVRATGGINVVQILCSLIGCSLIESLGDPLSQVFAITTSVVDDVFYGLLDLLGIAHIEVDRLINLLPGTPLISGATQPPGGLSDSSPVQFLRNDGLERICLATRGRRDWCQPGTQLVQRLGYGNNRYH
jgi:hypothetical protein